MNDEKEFQLFLSRFGEQIRHLREEAKLTQEEMSELIDYKYFQKIEYGQKNITLKTIYKICKKLNISPKDLFNFKLK